MKNPFVKEESEIDAEIKRVIEKISKLSPFSKRYSDAVQNLNTLYEARANEVKPKISGDAILMAVTNILGIVLILNYEKMDVLSSKAVSFIAKGRIS